MLTDHLSLGLLAIGTVAIAAWYVEARQERGRRIAEYLPEETAMDDSDSHKQLVRLVAQLPATLDRDRMRDSLLKDIETFRSTPGLLDQFFLKIRSKYSSRFEREVLEDVKATLQAQINLIAVGVQWQSDVDSIGTRVETGKLEARTKLAEAKVAHDTATARASGSVRTAELQAENAALEEEARRAEIQLRKAEAERKMRDLQREPEASEAAARPKTPEEEQEEIARRQEHQRTKEYAKKRGDARAMMNELERLNRERKELTDRVLDDSSMTEEQKADRVRQIKDYYAKLMSELD